VGHSWLSQPVFTASPILIQIRGNMTFLPGSPSPLLAEFALRRSLYEEFRVALERLAWILISKKGVSVEISSRTKDVDSLDMKLRRKLHYESLSDVPDLVGIRIIAQTASDVSAISNLVASQMDLREDVLHGSPNDGETFGYAGRHLVVQLAAPRVDLPEWRLYRGLRCEIQVRTILQHAWASISHSLLYKVEEDVPADVRRTLGQVAALIEVGDGLFQRFRDEVEELRSEYAEQAQTADGSWREVAINLDSMGKLWDKWKPKRLVGHPFAQMPLCHVIDRSLVNDELYPDPQFLSNLTAESNRLDLANLGQLADLVASDGFRDRILELVKSTTPDSGISTVPLDFLIGVGSYYGRENPLRR
jgi:ppGpp synthetase/RelA/SpoT-type nucleotidyltranferase